jgi:DNA-binding FadR family transcriptional regulator
VKLDDLFEAWCALVPVCGRLAAKHITPEQLSGLRQTLARMKKYAAQSRLFTREEVRFHMLITHATNNAVLRIYGTSLAELTFKQIQHVPFTRDEMQQGLSACQAILESIEQGDAERVERRIAKHLAAIGEDISRLAGRLDLQPAEVTGVVDHLTETVGED